MTKGLSVQKRSYTHAWLLLYFLIYMPWFGWLNIYTPQRTNATEIYCGLDDMIPFMEIFVIPYFLWFAYIAFGFVFLFFSSRSEFIRMCTFLYTGMTICLIIYDFSQLSNTAGRLYYTWQKQYPYRSDSPAPNRRYAL